MKDMFLIKGLAGKKTLMGKIPVFGAKNGALPAFASALLFRNEVCFENVPYIQDIKNTAEILEKLGAQVTRTDAHTWRLDAQKVTSTSLDEKLSKHMRASILFSGPLLARYGEVTFPHPGGCVLGERPIDIFIECFEKMGATCTFINETYTISSHSKPLHGAELFLRIPSPTVTETIMMAATLAKGTTIIKNAAMEPEIESLATFFNSCGAQISGAGTPTVTIIGGKPLEAKHACYQTIPDRIEAGSFLILGALAGKDITVTHCIPEHIRSVIESLRQAGVAVDETENSLRIKAPTSKSTYTAVNVKTHEYPGFPTDLQAPMTIFLTQIAGESQVFETLFEGRLNYAHDLIKMGADIKIWGAHTMTVKGPTPLKGHELDGPDLRAGLAYILAGIIASGRAVVNNVHFIDRGYEQIEKRLKAVGVDIERVSN